MNEEIEYAEMLEIPVSTVNVVKKKSRRVRGKNAPNLKERLISRVNNRVNGGYDAEPAFAEAAPVDSFAQNPVYASAENAALESAANAPEPESDVNAYAYAEGGERLDTVLLSDAPKGKGKKKKFSFFKTPEYDDYAASDDAENDGYIENERGMYETNAPSARRTGIALTVEFALACALCGTIFLTNVFMPTSAINTFFRSIMPANTVNTDTRAYNDFTLTGVVSELADADITLSPTGVLTFTAKCCVYPAVDGKVSAVTKNSDGTYDVKISHTDSFYGIIGGLDYVYYATGDSVYSNVPVGYSNGKTAVRVTMYSGDELLNCYTVDSENCLSWVTES